MDGGRIMGYVVVFLIGVIAGAAMMCLVQINRR